MSHEDVTLLFVEDDAIDIESLHRTFRQNRLRNPVVVARDGVEAFAILRGEDGHERLARPYVVLLDLNMPRMNGFEFLEELRKDPELTGTVVFVMSTSEDERDVRRAFANHAAGYIVKNDAGRLFASVVELLERYWQVVHLPKD